VEHTISLRVEVSFFVLRPEIEDRDEVEVVIGRSIKTSSILNDKSVQTLTGIKFVAWT
jgi:hypothetical protein